MVDKTVKENELFACRICLAINMELHSIRESKLEDILIDLMGNTQSPLDRLPQHICGYCKAQLLKCVNLRARYQRSQALLKKAFAEQRIITMDYLQTLDRVAEQLTVNLKIFNVFSTDLTALDETVKSEDEIKVETNDPIDNIFVGELAIDYDSGDNNDNELNNEHTSNTKNDVKLKKITSRQFKRQQNHSKLTDSKTTKEKGAKKRKLLETTKTSTVGKRKPDVGGRTKRIIKRRMADNGFLPDFNFDEFQSKYNVKIDILSKEEQLREIEAKKMTPSYALSAFGCEICGKAFATKQVYDVHMMKHSVSSGAHACEICQVRFKTRSRAHVHQDTHRLRFTCEQCGFLTRTRFIAKNHFLSHAGTTHKCPHCDAIFNKYTSYLTHVRRRHPAMNTACDECGETFVGANGLRHHKTRVHRNRKLPGNPLQYKCSSCGARFASSQALDKHINSAPANGCDTNMRPCPQCGENLFNEEMLKSHQEEFHAPRTHLCRECNKTFVDSCSFDTHYSRIHLNIRLKEPPRARPRHTRAFICEQCGNECTSLTNLMAHQRSHSGAKPHACPACPLHFSSLHNMQRHHRVVHLGQRPQVKCSICGKLLAHAASLKLHVSTVHLKLPAPPRQRRRPHDD